MQKVFSFFYRKGPLSSEIRGRQIGKFLGARHNPTTDYINNICILVKVIPKTLFKDRGLIFNRESMYFDIMDYAGAITWLKGRSNVRVIVSSRSAETFLKSYCHNSLTYIPQHHCNTERKLRENRPVKTVAFVGSFLDGPPPWYDRVNSAVFSMGMEMKYFTNFKSREDVVNYYDQVDIQFTWRDGMPDKLCQLKNSLKVINAASFGIPTVSSLEPPYVAECKDRYIGTETISDALDAIRALQIDSILYEKFSTLGPTMAEPYHITNVAELYKKLAN